jgi:Flp pilus assembly protein CpaB
LVCAAGVVAFAAVLSGTKPATRQYVVANRPIPAGSVIEASELSSEAISLPASISGNAFSAEESLVGRTLASPIQPGELIESSMLDPPAPPVRPVSIPVNPDSLLGLLPGEKVDVLAVPPPSVEGASSGSAASGSASSGTAAGSAQPGGALPGSSVPTAASTVVMRGAVLLSVAPSPSGLAGTTGTLSDVTLGVANLSEVELLVATSQNSTVELVLSEPSDGTGPGPAGGTSQGASG